MSSLPIRRVVLYKHGVGYFEREGTVTDFQPVSLTFKQREVSDVLKSLTVLDLNGGVVSAVSYDSTTPVEQLLAEIALIIPDKGSLIGLLPQLKGARVVVRPIAANNPVHGMLLGIDTVETNTDAGVTNQIRVSVLSDGGQVKTFDLFDVELQLLDDGLKRDLDFYLKTHLASKKKDSRTFTLFAQGDGERTLRASYVLEAPVWKATYRILLDDSPLPSEREVRGEGDSLLQVPPHPQPLSPGGEGGKTLIQGWAVVDNTSDEDWEDVNLTLVAGLPVSFVHDLYTPRFIRRPVVEVRETTGVLPPMAEAGVEYESFDSMLTEFRDSDNEEQPKLAKRRMPGLAFTAGAPASAFSMSPVSSVQTQTRERQVGDLFEYIIDKPVTVRRNQSALVPIVLKPFAGRSVLLYQKAARPENPIRCVEFENTTGLTLEGGPVTVLDQGSYVGEAMLETLKPREKRLVGYAVELAVRVTDSINTKNSKVFRVVLRKGTMTLYYGQVQKTTYTFSSKSDQDQVVYLDHPRHAEWELVDTQPPHEVTENYWRFQFTLTANKTLPFVAKCQQTLLQSFSLHDVSDVQLMSWAEEEFLDAKTVKVIRETFAVRRQIAELDKKITELDQERTKLHQEQARIRENLAPLGDRASEKELRERYIRTLTQQEDRLEKIDQERATAVSARDSAAAKVNEILNGLNYEGAVGG
jgi:hypothetical protein